MTQPTISNQINRLEKELNVKLFERTYHNVSLTTEGKLLLPFVLDTLKREQRYLNDLKRLHNFKNKSLTGELRIGMYLKEPANHLINYVKKFKSYQSQVKIIVDNLNGDDLANSLNSHQIDWAVGMIKPLKNVTWHFLYKDHFVAAVAGNGNIQKNITSAELKNKQLINLPLKGLSDYRQMQKKILNVDNVLKVHSLDAGLSNLQLFDSYMLLPSTICRDLDMPITQLNIVDIDSKSLEFSVGIASMNNYSNYIDDFLRFIDFFEK